MIGHNGGPPLLDRPSGPQYELISSTKRFPAMVAGFGAGKTDALVKRALRLKFAYWQQNVAYYLPTYDLVKTIVRPRLSEVLGRWNYFEGVHYHLNKSDNWLDFAPMGGGKVILRTMDSPERIIGYEVADSCVDELDTLKTENARDVWRKIIARNRQKKPDHSTNSVAVGTTPEGFRFVYETWYKKPPSDQYELIRATTYSNQANLPLNYIDDLKDAYPANLVAAYLNGEFVNLTSGSVYPGYDRKLNASPEIIRRVVVNDKVDAEPLHIGLDFNVTKMAAVIHVYRAGLPHAVFELVDMYDTPAFIKLVKERWQAFGHHIFVYPDASGNARKSINASVTDLALLSQAGFTVVVDAANPAVRDRVVSMNVMLEKRKLRVNETLCPNYAAALEQQVYDKNGEPDKTGGKDHINDAGGYFISNRFPVVRPTAGNAALGGI
jgi:hypothetical protein